MFFNKFYVIKHFRNGFLSSTDLGRIASYFYINFNTVEKFNDLNGNVKLTSFVTDANILSLISCSSEFSQITVIFFVIF